MGKTWQDMRYALRMLWKTPGFTIVAVLTLALGIGANTAIFSVVNTVMLKPLPYADASRLLSILEADPDNGGTPINLSFSKFREIAAQSQSFDSVAAFYPITVSLVTRTEPEPISAAHASRDIFRVLGATPALGRNFLPAEDSPGGANVAVVSNNFWHSHFGGDPNLIGQTVNLDGVPVTVIGILPPSFRFPISFPEPDVWLPRIFEPNFLKPVQVESGAGFLIGLARLRPDQTLASAQAELNTINGRYRQEFPNNADAPKYDLQATHLEDLLIGPLRPSLIVLLAAVGFVLLIACANVASLLLVRATARQKEIAIRKALGASRLRLIRQLLSESLVLALVGGVLGVALAAALLPFLRLITPGTVPRLEQTSIDGVVLLFTLVLCTVTGIAFGIVPALQISGRDLHDTLKEGGRGSSEGGLRNRARSALVVAEVAVALVLMTGAGLLIKSFVRLMDVNPGFDPHNTMIFPFNLPPARYPLPESQAQFARQLVDRVKTLPSVESASLVSHLPLSGALRYVFFCAEGMVCQGIGKDPIIAMRQVSPDYFRTVHTSLLRGRVFTAQDTATTEPVAIVNQTVADKYWPGQDPIGKHLMNSRDKIQRLVVGVVSDVKFNSLNAPDAVEMYWPLEQFPWPALTLLVRSNSTPAPLVAAVRKQLAELDPNVSISGIQSMDELVSTSVAQPRLIMLFTGIFAALALLLAAVGIYAVMAYSVSQRRQEMGIRMALGAQPRHILRLVVGHGMWLTLAGVVLGVVASFGLTRLLAALLFGIRATDPLAFTAAATLLVGTALCACYVPARRATRLDPLLALRYE